MLRRSLSKRTLFFCISAIAIGNAILLLAQITYFQRKGPGIVERALHLDYNVVGLGINWIQFGGVRRGLAGSIIYLTGIKLQYAPFILYGASYIAFILLSFFMLKRMASIRVSTLVPFLLIFAALLLFWSRDIGRTDMLVAAILIAAALALVEGRSLLASLFIAVGALVHEASAIYGLPLLAAILIDNRRYTRFRLDRLAYSAAIIAAGVVIYGLIPIAHHSDNRTIVATITSEAPSIQIDQFTSMAFYYDLGGLRAWKTSICRIAGPNHFFQLLIALMMISITIFSLNGRRWIKWIQPAIASVPPIIFLWAAADDMSRWVTLSILNVWIVSAARNYQPVEDGGRRLLRARVICAAVIVPLLYPKTGYDWYPSALIQTAIEVASGRHFYRTQEECDPGWLSVLSQKQ